MQGTATTNAATSPLSYEQQLNRYIYRQDIEKTFIDKVLGRQDSERLRALMQKEDLTRTDLSELLYLMAGINTKLVNFSDYDRYLLGKFYAWIRDFVTLCEEIIDYQTDVNDPNSGLVLGAVGIQLKTVLVRVKNHNLHNCKFLIDVFLYLSNSTLSIGGAGFDTLTTSKFEYAYPYELGGAVQPQQAKGSVLNIFSKRGR